jgi:hypothetical protein
LKRVIVVAEGQTEQAFVVSTLAPTLWPAGICLRAALLGHPGHKGGGTSYERVKEDVSKHLKQDREVYVSTMLDLYGLGAGFPGTPTPSGLSNIAKAEHIERKIQEDICRSIPKLRQDRFVPYIQLHEYEALLFSDPIIFADAISQPHLAGRFQKIRSDFETPEDIDDSPTTAPSKRVLQTCRSYQKPLRGTIAARAIGVQAMRRECPHFRKWLEQLEALAHL